MCKIIDSKGVEEIFKKRKIVSFEYGEFFESFIVVEENVFVLLCLVNLDFGIRISIVVVGGCYMLVLLGEFSFKCLINYFF